MDKKKISGLVIFVLALGIYINYPQIKGWRLERNVMIMMENEQYQEIYDLLTEKEVEYLSLGYMSLLKSEIRLGLIDDAKIKVVRLVNNKQLVPLQDLVDEMGEELGDLLIIIDKVEGIVIDEDLQPYFVEILYHNGFIGRAMEFGYEIKEFDSTLIYHLVAEENIELLIEIHDDIPKRLKQEYYTAINFELIYWKTLRLSEEEGTKYLDNLAKLTYPEEILQNMATLTINLTDMPVFNHPFIRENIYYELAQTLYLLENPTTKPQGLLELKSGKFQGVKGIDKIIEIVVRGVKLDSIEEVNSNGILSYYHNRGSEVERYNAYDLGLDKEFNIGIEGFTGSSSVSSVSPHRKHKGVVQHLFEEKVKLLVIDDMYQVVAEIEADGHYVFVDYWIDDYSFVFSQAKNDGTTERQVYNIRTKETTKYSGEQPYAADFSHTIQEARIWAINDERYISIEPGNAIEPDIHSDGTTKYYTIRDRKTHHEILKVAFDFMFIGSCEEYIYGLVLEGGFLEVLVKMDIKTKEVTKLPFYTFGNGVNIPPFIHTGYRYYE